MPLEIRELVVKVTVDENQKNQDGIMTPQEKKSLIDQCKRQVLKELERKARR